MLWECIGHLLERLGPNDNHTAWAKDRKTLDDWASSKAVAHGSFTQYSFIRPDAQSVNARTSANVHVDIRYNETTGVDYVMFMNIDSDGRPIDKGANGNGRWYYGRVMHREYVNINSTRLWFVLDYWLTFFDIVEFGKCFIKRSHIKFNDDWNGDFPGYVNMLAEPVSCEIYEQMYDDWNRIINSAYDTELHPHSYILLAATATDGVTTATGFNAGAPIAGVNYSCVDEIVLQKIIQEYSDFGDFQSARFKNILDIVNVPHAVAESTLDTVVKIYQGNFTALTRKDYPRTDGALVKNAKCLLYPYSYYTAKSAVGQQIVIKPQFDIFRTDNTFNFAIFAWGGSQAGNAMVITKDMFGTHTPPTLEDINLRMLPLPDYPHVGAATDSFAMWNATQAGYNTTLQYLSFGKAVGTIAADIASIHFASGNPLVITGAVKSMINAGFSNAENIASLNEARQNAMNQPDIVVGAVNGYANRALKRYRPIFYKARPSNNEMTYIDDFFECFGYNVSCYAKPNVHVRKYWTFVQTTNAIVKGNFPHDGIVQIEKMLNNGMTFWNIEQGEIGQERDPDFINEDY